MKDMLAAFDRSHGFQGDPFQLIWSSEFAIAIQGCAVKLAILAAGNRWGRLNCSVKNYPLFDECL